jgi:hypothetical protein
VKRLEDKFQCLRAAKICSGNESLIKIVKERRPELKKDGIEKWYELICVFSFPNHSSVFG